MNKGIYVSPIITDTFGLKLPLEEQNDSLVTLDEFIQQVKECINKVNQINFKISFNEIDHFEILSGTNIVAGITAIGDSKYIFSINKAMLRNKCRYLFDTIIYHELCHILQLDYLFMTDFISFNTKTKLIDILYKDIVLVKKFLTDNGGHTIFWRGFANKINKLLKPVPPVGITLDQENTNLVFNEEKTESSIIAIPADFIVDYWPEIFDL